MKIFAGYGSTKDISVYTSIGIPSSQIYIVGRPSKKLQNQCQVPLDYCMLNLGNTQTVIKIIQHLTLVWSNTATISTNE